jgi:hypothetical protein
MGRPESVMREAKTVFLFYLTDDNLDNHLFVEWHKKNNRISRENKRSATGQIAFGNEIDTVSKTARMTCRVH